MTIYNIEYNDGILNIGFGEETATNELIVPRAAELLKELLASGDIKSREILKISGPASLPVAMQIASQVQHQFGAIACFDPKLERYVVCISHDPVFKLGETFKP